MARDPLGAGSQERERQLGEDLHRLREMCEFSEGNKILARTYANTTSYRVFQRNYMELKNFLDHMGDPNLA